MKSIVFVIFSLILLCVGLAGCGGDRAAERELDRADSLIDSAPDSAAALLDSLDTAVLSNAGKARMQLLSTKAHSKFHNSIASDTMIRQATDYYSGSGDSLEWQSLFYYAEVLAANRDFITGMMPSLRGYELARQSGDDFYAGMLARRLCKSYYALTNPELSLKWGETARRHFEKAGRERHAAYMLIDICNTLFLQSNFKGVIDKAAEADSAVIASDPDFRKNLGNVVFSALHRLGRNREAVDCFTRYLESSRQANNKVVQSNKWSELSEVYLDLGDVASAEAARDSAAAGLSTTVDSLYLSLIDGHLARRRGDYAKAAELFEQWGFNYSNELERRLVSPHTAIITEYLSQKAEEERIASRHKTTIILMTVIIALLIIATLGLVIMAYRSRVRLHAAENEALIGRLHTLEDDLRDSEARSLSGEITELFAYRFDELNRLCEVYYSACQGKPGNAEKKILSEIHEIIHDTVSDKSIQKLEDAINSHDNGWMAQFRTDMPNLSNLLYRLVILIYCGFSTHSLSILFGTSGTNAIYQNKYRLKKAILESGSPRSDKYIARLRL